MTCDMFSHVTQDILCPKKHVINVKILQQDKDDPHAKKPKTELDAKFLAAVAEYMSSKGISSDRAMSIALGRKENFLNRVRNGYQSATPEAWSALLDKYPEAQNITNTTVTSHGGQAVGTVQGDNIYAPTTLEACQLELEQNKRELVSIRAELERAQQQIAAQAALLESKDALIAAKDEMLTFLRGGHNRPN